LFVCLFAEQTDVGVCEGNATWFLYLGTQLDGLTPLVDDYSSMISLVSEDE
jgi:hypothetical protein